MQARKPNRMSDHVQFGDALIAHSHPDGSAGMPPAVGETRLGPME